MTVSTAREVRTGALLVVLLVVAGAVLGVVWNLVAPTVPIEIGENGELLFVDVSSPQEFIGSDGWYAVIAAAAGLVTGPVVWWRLRQHPFGALVGLAVGGVLGSVVMWRLGVELGPPDIPADRDALTPGELLEAPRRLGAKGLLALWSAVAVGLYLVLDLVTETVSDEPEPSSPEWLEPGRLG